MHGCSLSCHSRKFDKLLLVFSIDYTTERSMRPIRRWRLIPLASKST
jgi:hypothetical protein